MTTLNPAGQPAQTQRATRANYTHCPLCGKQTTCTAQDNGTLFECANCDIGIFVPADPAKDKTFLVSPGSPNELPGVTKSDYCISPPITGVFEHPFRFDGWDHISDRLKYIYMGAFGKRPAFGSFDILRWRFDDSNFWHKELCPVPVGCWLAVEWGTTDV